MSRLFLAIATLLFSQHSVFPQESKPDISEREAIDFARKMESLLLAGRSDEFDALFDMEEVVENAIRDVPLSAKDAESFRKGSVSGFNPGKKLVPASGCSYRFLRIYPSDGKSQPEPLFRMFTSGGLNYHHYRLRRSKKGELRIAEMFNHMAGEWLTPVWRRYAVALVALDPDRRDLVSEQDRAFARSIASIKEMESDLNQGGFAKALAIYEKLPAGVRRERVVQWLRIRAAIKGSDEDFVKAEEEFNRIFPDDFSKDLLGFDAHITRKRFDLALRGLNRVDQAVGGDPALRIHKGAVYIHLGKWKEAKEELSNAVSAVPYLAQPYWLLLSVSLKEKAHSDTVRLLVILEREFKAGFKSLESNSEYADFVMSPEYRDWMKSRAAK